MNWLVKAALLMLATISGIVVANVAIEVWVFDPSVKDALQKLVHTGGIVAGVFIGLNAAFDKELG